MAKATTTTAVKDRSLLEHCRNDRPLEARRQQRVRRAQRSDQEALSGRGGSKTFTIHGLCKIVVQHKPATKERQGINPFTGEQTTFKAKPARNVVKIRPLKKLKDMVS